MVRCPNCGRTTDGDYCQWCGYPVMAGGSGRMEAGKAREGEARARGPEAPESSSKLKKSFGGCGCLLILAAVVVGIIIASNSHGNPHYIYENGAVIVGGDGKAIELIDNPNATNPTYAELVAFIKEDSTDEHLYVISSYNCSDFAEDVHNNAEATGIRAAWVGIHFEGDDEGHACNAFETTDKGLVYVDCTGRGFEDLISLLWSSGGSWDKIAYVEVGKEYGLLAIARASSLSYSFYEEYEQKWQEYKRKQQELEKLLSEWDEEVNRHNEEISKYGSSPEETERFSAALDENTPKRYELGDELSALQQELGDSWFELPSVVKEIQIYWHGGRE
jgi:hypothetical protein